jgi:hypothetical protein
VVDLGTDLFEGGGRVGNEHNASCLEESVIVKK